MYYSAANSFAGGYLILYTLLVLVWAVIWGSVTKSIYSNKGYDGGFWLGFFLGVIGLIIALTKPDNNVYYSQPKDDFFQRLQSANEEKRKQETEASGIHDKPAALGSNATWTCSRCGKTNPNYIGTCGCGMNRSEQERMKNENKAEADDTIINEKEKAGTGAKGKSEKVANQKDKLETIQMIRGYKELLDCGAISQEEFDRKKEELLKL